MYAIALRFSLPVLLGFPLLCFGQAAPETESQMKLFLIPEIKLRSFEVPTDSTPPASAREMSEGEMAATSSPADLASPTTHLELSVGQPVRDLWWRDYRRVEIELVRPEKDLSDRPVDRVLDSIFQPEVVHFGKGHRMTVSCSVWTAIQRKNPLCLLNPFFFQLSF